MSERSFTTAQCVVRATGVKGKVERAALELFATHGVDGVAIGDIAERAGVSQGALYRHYPSKDELAWTLFSQAYLRTGAELEEIRAREHDFRSRVTSMVAHFCALFDADPALFRFMLLAQHGFLRRVDTDLGTPVQVIESTIEEAVKNKESAPVNPAAATAIIMGVVLQTATFHIYDRLSGPLSAQASALARAALSGVAALADIAS